MAGTRSDLPFVPIDESATTYFSDGTLTFGVEYRIVNPGVLADTFGTGSETLDKIEAAQAGLDDQGVSLHVIENATRFECFRFDMFADSPHYHYNYGATQVTVEYDQVALGPMPSAVRGMLTRHLPAMFDLVEKPRLADYARTSPPELATALDAAFTEITRAQSNAPTPA